MVLGVAVSGALFSFYESKAAALYALQGQSGMMLSSNAFTYALHRTFVVAAMVALISMTASLTKGKVRTERQKGEEPQNRIT